MLSTSRRALFCHWQFVDRNLESKLGLAAGVDALSWLLLGANAIADATDARSTTTTTAQTLTLAGGCFTEVSSSSTLEDDDRWMRDRCHKRTDSSFERQFLSV